MAQVLNVVGKNGRKISNSIAEFDINHNSVDSRFTREHYLYMKYTKNGDADTGYLQYKARDSERAAALGLSGEDAFFDIRDKDPVTSRLTKVTDYLPSGEAISTGVFPLLLPKNWACDAMRVIYYSPVSGELTLAAVMD